MAGSDHKSADSTPSSPASEKAVFYDGQHVEHASGNGSKVWRKMDLHILPVVTMIFFLAFLDRANIGNAKVAGLQKDLKMTNKQYAIAITVTYVPYIAIELPSNLLLKIVGPNILIPCMILGWGIVSTLQGVVTTFGGLVACRFFLGLFEGGLLPGITLYLSTFYPRSKLQSRVAVFFTSATLTGAFSGLLAAAIMKMNGDGGKSGWAWIFILEGLFTIVFAAATFFILPRSVASSGFLTAEDKTFVEETLREDGALARSEAEDSFKWSEVAKTFTQPQVFFMAIAGFFNGSTLFGLAYFTPVIVASLGYTANQAQLMSVPPFAASFVVALITAWVSDHYRCRGATSIFCSILSIVGFAMFLKSNSNHVKYGSLFLLLPGTYCAAPALGAWTANNSAPYVRRATAIAILTTMTNSGGILSTWLLSFLSPAPKYTKATVTFLIFSVGIFVTSALNLAYLVSQNRKKEMKRREMSREAEARGLGDESAWFTYNL